jgi:signal transduction histidine kinase
MLSSLSNRIFLASALLAVLSIGTALFLVNVVVTRQAEAELEENLLEAGELVTQFQSLFFATLLTEARIVADVSRLKAAVDTRHPPTVKPLAEEYREAIQADLIVVTHRNGSVLAVIGEPGLTPEQLIDQRIVKAALAGRSAVDVWSEGSGLLQVVSVPIFIDPAQPEVLGTLTAGLRLDRALADRIKAITRSDVVFVEGGQPRGSTLPAAVTAALLAVPDDGRLLRATIDGEEYEAVRRRLVIEAPGTLRSRTGPGTGGPLAIVARSRTAHLAFLRNLHSALAATTAVAVLVATLLSFAVARTVTRPLRALTATMREMAATGVATVPAEPPRPTPWDDEDARLLTGTFHALTGSLDRFQREAAQRERLSSLGRLSTVIAHEIRNPLMIIKGSLRSLRRGVATPDEVAGVAADIEGEVTRLNRVVNDVLDYAKPIALTYDTIEVDRLVRDAAQAVVASQSGPPDVVVEASAGVTAVTDGDRLRQVVINLVTNARDAVLARRPDAVAGATADDAGAPMAMPPIHVRARLAGDDQVEISVADRGVGMSDVEVARMFEPFFTTKRRGSGIGLAVSKNIVDGLGGRIDVESASGVGTTIRLTLPRSRPAAPPADTTTVRPAAAPQAPPPPPPAASARQA